MAVLALAAALAAPAAAPTLSLGGAPEQRFTTGGTSLAFDVRVLNPTDAALGVTAVEYALEILGKRVVEGTLPAGADVGARASISFPVVTTLRWADLPGMGLRAAFGKAKYRLTVAVTVRTPLGAVVLPLAYDGELSVPRQPGFGLAGLHVVSWNPFDAAVEVRVEVKNENGFPLPPGLLRYRVAIAGSDVSSAEVALPAIGPGAKVVVPVPIALSLRKTGQGVVRALKGDATTVGLHAVASIADLSFPVDVETELPVLR